MPTFLECTHCGRLYSRHSLLIHEKNCQDSMQKVIEQEHLRLQTARKPRGRSTSKNGAKNFKKPEFVQERPRTRSLSRYNHENDGIRVCFVCGEQFDEKVIEEHKEKCFRDWTHQTKSLSPRFQCYKPKILETPSVDGTVDVTRENMRAIQSAHSCQIVRCRYCNARISMQLAHGHVCVRFEPTIEFYM